MKHNRPARSRMTVESLEDRCVPATISIGDATAIEGDPAYRFTDNFVAPDGYGLASPRGKRVGPDGNLYVASHDTDVVKVFEGGTGRFLRDLVAAGGALDGPWALEFDSASRLYVSGRYSHNIVRFDIGTGVSEVFVPTGSGGLGIPWGMTFGPDGDIYTSAILYEGAPGTTTPIKRFSGTTGAYLGDFVTANSGGMANPSGIVFGPDGKLYVASAGSREVKRYHGQTGAFLDNFITVATGGQNAPVQHLLFYNDGLLYITYQALPGIFRYSSTTGTFVDMIAAPPNSSEFGTTETIFTPSGEFYVSMVKAILQSGQHVARYAPASFAAFTISLDATSASPVSVQFATGPGSALVGSDYSTATGTVDFAPGQTTRTILVQTVNDATVESTESFAVNLSNPTGATIADGQAVGTITDDDGGTKFFVVDDASTDRTYRYGAAGSATGNSPLNPGNSPKSGSTSPRGVAANAAGTTVWVADANRRVYVYDAGGTPLGNWTAGNVNRPEGIATNNTDLWIVDSQTDRVYRYTNAAGRRDRSQDAASSFALAAGNTNPKGIVTDGTSFWVVDDGATDRVFKYTLGGASLGSWTIDAQNASPTGLTLDPTAPSDVWIVDNGTDRVYRYANAAAVTSGSQSATSSFALAAGNTNPQDIADPPTAFGVGRARPRGPMDQLAANALPPDDFDFAPVVVNKPRGLARRF